MMINKLEVDSVILEFDTKRVLQDVYLKSEEGKVTGILGRNGAGKSCLLKIIFGELVPFDKSVRINGYSLIGEERISSDMKYLPQFKFIPETLTLKRIFSDFNINFQGLISIIPEFDKYYKTKLKHLSGGEQRIVEIYSILASKTKFCLLDEPFSHIMPVHVDKIKKMILREKKNKGIIITDHMYRHIVDISDDLYVITNGKTYLTKDIMDIEKLGYARISKNTAGNKQYN
jgi:ABC-type multidrug transport system ATPase subunit